MAGMLFHYDKDANIGTVLGNRHTLLTHTHSLSHSLIYIYLYISMYV
jgi:hypothetical protein